MTDYIIMSPIPNPNLKTYPVLLSEIIPGNMDSICFSDEISKGWQVVIAIINADHKACFFIV